MSIKQINPLIQHISVDKTAKENDRPFSFGRRQVVNYELERIGSSYGKMILNDVTYYLKENDIFLRKPGQIVEGIAPYRFQHMIFTVDEQDIDTQRFLNNFPDKLNVSHSPNIQRMFDEIQQLFLSNDEISPILMKSRMLELLYELSVQSIRSKYNRHIKAALQFIEHHYTEPINVEDIAKYIGISPTYLFQQFKKVLSDTPMGYVNRVRLEKSKSLLLDSDYSVMDIAMACGYNSVSYFNYTFKKHMGISPTGFRKRYVRYISFN